MCFLRKKYIKHYVCAWSSFASHSPTKKCSILIPPSFEYHFLVTLCNLGKDCPFLPLLFSTVSWQKFRTLLQLNVLMKLKCHCECLWYKFIWYLYGIYNYQLAQYSNHLSKFKHKCVVCIYPILEHIA